eukprot:GHVQ01001894.1.p1 GENE.GHVQ01001894.1~~GHVQ01001894.1.p1  ORF type:complete len:872 (-),score=129.74 GHVQ01001894.1:2418-4775(-)
MPDLPPNENINATIAKFAETKDTYECLDLCRELARSDELVWYCNNKKDSFNITEVLRDPWIPRGKSVFDIPLPSLNMMKGADYPLGFVHEAFPESVEAFHEKLERLLKHSKDKVDARLATGMYKWVNLPDDFPKSSRDLFEYTAKTPPEQVQKDFQIDRLKMLKRMQRAFYDYERYEIKRKTPPTNEIQMPTTSERVFWQMVDEYTDNKWPMNWMFGYELDTPPLMYLHPSFFDDLEMERWDFGHMLHEKIYKTYWELQKTNFSNRQKRHIMNVNDMRKRWDWARESYIGKEAEEEAGFTYADTETAIWQDALKHFGKLDLSLQPGQIVFGEVVLVFKNEIHVNCGHVHLGVLDVKEVFTQDELVPESGLLSIFRPGDAIYVEVKETRRNILLLSLRRLREINGWERILHISQTGETFTGQVKDVKRAGVILDVAGVSAYMPSTHLSVDRQMTKGLKGRRLSLKLLEFDPAANRIVVSERRAKAEEEIGKLEAGTLVEGVVSQVASYGVLVMFGNIKALLSANNVSGVACQDKLAKLFKKGDKIKAAVIDKDTKNLRVFLSTKVLETHPGELLSNKSNVYNNAEETVKVYQASLDKQTKGFSFTVGDLIKSLGLDASAFEMEPAAAAAPLPGSLQHADPVVSRSRTEGIHKLVKAKRLELLQGRDPSVALTPDQDRYNKKIADLKELDIARQTPWDVDSPDFLKAVPRPKHDGPRWKWLTKQNSWQDLCEEGDQEIKQSLKENENYAYYKRNGTAHVVCLQGNCVINLANLETQHIRPPVDTDEL